MKTKGALSNAGGAVLESEMPQRSTLLKKKSESSSPNDTNTQSKL